MSILKIARLGHPILYQKAALIEDITQPDIKNLVQDMTETMLDAKGIGLAAPQVHVSKQIIIFREQEDKEVENKEIKIVVVINPKIYKISDDTDNQWEGCLSIPGILGLVKRYTSISYKGFDLNGNIIQQNVNGLCARIIQHEYDHLMGMVYTDRLVNKKAYGYEDEIEEYWKKAHE